MYLIFPGHFNPIHVGHVKLINAAFNFARPELLIIVPLYIENEITQKYRIEMLRNTLLTEFYRYRNSISLSNIGLKTIHGSGTLLNLLEDLKAQYEFELTPKSCGVLLGSLTLTEDKNFRAHKIFDHASVYVFLQEPQTEQELRSQFPMNNMIILPGLKSKANSKIIRYNIQQNKSFDEFVSGHVKKYIEINKLYV